MAKSYRLLRSILSTAVDDELIARNPCRLKGAGTEAAPERPVLSLVEVFRLADVIEQRYRALVLLAVFGSLRFGELMGLTRDDVDCKRATVHVRRAIAEVNGQLVVKAPKSAAGRRSVALPQWIVGEVQLHLDRYAEAGESGRVFIGPKGATPRRAHFSITWRRARSAAGVPDGVHFHDLRHTGNHLAALTGASTRELMARMGALVDSGGSDLPARDRRPRPGDCRGAGRPGGEGQRARWGHGVAGRGAARRSAGRRGTP